VIAFGAQAQDRQTRAGCATRGRPQAAGPGDTGAESANAGGCVLTESSGSRSPPRCQAGAALLTRPLTCGNVTDGGGPGAAFRVTLDTAKGVSNLWLSVSAKPLSTPTTGPQPSRQSKLGSSRARRSSTSSSRSARVT